MSKNDDKFEIFHDHKNSFSKPKVDAPFFIQKLERLFRAQKKLLHMIMSLLFDFSYSCIW